MLATGNGHSLPILFVQGRPNTFKCPRVLVEIASLDTWDQHWVEGYGYFDLPDRPGEELRLLTTTVLLTLVPFHSIWPCVCGL